MRHIEKDYLIGVIENHSRLEKEKLLIQKKETQEKYYYYRDYQKEMDSVCANIHSILGRQHTRVARQLEREDIS